MVGDEYTTETFRNWLKFLEERGEIRMSNGYEIVGSREEFLDNFWTVEDINEVYEGKKGFYGGLNESLAKVAIGVLEAEIDRELREDLAEELDVSLNTIYTYTQRVKDRGYVFKLSDEEYKLGCMLVADTSRYEYEDLEEYYYSALKLRMSRVDEK